MPIIITDETFDKLVDLAAYGYQQDMKCQDTTFAPITDQRVIHFKDCTNLSILHILAMIANHEHAQATVRHVIEKYDLRQFSKPVCDTLEACLLPR